MSSRSEAERDETDSLSLPQEVEPVDAGAWAAAVTYPPEERRRVQFAPDASVTLFDVDTEAGESEEGGFEPPFGREMAAVVLSISGLTVLSVAAVLTTVYDWVL